MHSLIHPIPTPSDDLTGVSPTLSAGRGQDHDHEKARLARLAEQDAAYTRARYSRMVNRSFRAVGASCGPVRPCC